MIWDASDANPMHRRLPAEVVSRRRAEKKPKAPEPTTDEVVVDLKTAITLKPEARTKWLSKACAMVEQGKAKPTDLYDIVTNRKFSGGLPDRVGRKLASIIRDSFSIFSDKQQRYLNSTESPVPMHLAAQEDEEAEEEEEAPRRPKRAPREEAPATATIPEITLRDADNKVASRKEKPPKEKPPPPGPVVEAPRRRIARTRHGGGNSRRRQTTFSEPWCPACPMRHRPFSPRRTLIADALSQVAGPLARGPSPPEQLEGGPASRRRGKAGIATAPGEVVDPVCRARAPYCSTATTPRTCRICRGMQRPPQI